jgi:nitroimidazol reductase NimA-like FMN-containing flavoprotein (pyridoxamine 5'-phosphate oxidase superfamily)
MSTGREKRRCPDFYCFSTLGRKIEWMRENPLVCVEVDEIVAHDNWLSVVALGHYLEFFPTLPKTRKARSMSVH